MTVGESLKISVSLPGLDPVVLDLGPTALGRDLTNEVNTLVPGDATFHLTHDGADVRPNSPLLSQGIDTGTLITAKPVPTRQCIAADTYGRIAWAPNKSHCILTTSTGGTVYDINRRAEVRESGKPGIVCAGVAYNGDLLVVRAEPRTVDIVVYPLHPRDVPSDDEEAASTLWGYASGRALCLPFAEVRYIGCGMGTVALLLERGLGPCLSLLTRSGDKLTVHSEWRLPADSKHYRAVAVAHDDTKIAILDNHSALVFIHCPRGELLHTFGHGVLVYPQDVAFDEVGYIVVGGCTVAGRPSVGVFSPIGRLLSTIPVRGWVWGVAVRDACLAVSTDFEGGQLTFYVDYAADIHESVPEVEDYTPQATALALTAAHQIPVAT